VEYAIIGENCVVEAGATVGGEPDGSEGWGVATCGPNVTVGPGHSVAANAMIYPGEEV
jgi:serine acetyltransferase